MDQGRDWGWALHGIGKPRVQQELRRLAHRPHEEEQASDCERIDLPAKEIDRLSGERRRLRKHGIQIDRTGQHEYGEDTERETEIADAIDDEGLDRGGVGFRFVIPEAD